MINDILAMGVGVLASIGLINTINRISNYIKKRKGEKVKRGDDILFIKNKIERIERDVIDNRERIWRTIGTVNEYKTELTKEIFRRSKGEGEDDFVYRTIRLQDEDILARRIDKQFKAMAVPVNEYEWFDFRLGSYWDVWEDSATLYYQAKVIGVQQCDGVGYVEFEVVGTPVGKP